MRTETPDRAHGTTGSQGAPRTSERPGSGIGPGENTGAGAGAGGGRGQTTLDFALGASLFLLALIGVLVFVSGTIQPFNEGSREDLGVADRVGDSLSEGLLAERGQPHVLNETCTVAFFDDTSPAYCRHSGANLTERVGVKHWKRLNVTMQANVTGGPGEETLCWDSTGERVVERGSGDCDVALTAGPGLPGNPSDTVTARRVVTINGTDATMRVEVW